MEKNDSQLIVINPYNAKHIALLKKFEARLNNHLPIQTSDILLEECAKISEEDYFQKKQRDSNVEENFCLVLNNEIKSSCYLEGNKINKVCNLTYVTPLEFQSQGYGKELLKEVVDYAITKFGMEKIELYINNNNSISHHMAIEAGFEQVSGFGVNSVYEKNVVTEKSKGYY